MRYRVEFERETETRWIADIPELPGVMVYGTTPADALAKVEALALHVLADRLEHGELTPERLESTAVAQAIKSGAPDIVSAQKVAYDTAKAAGASEADAMTAAQATARRAISRSA